jgi:probable phosphoglycerate mutase
VTDEPTSTSVILIRHGETRWNAEGRYQGQLDSPLTEEGVRQAEAIAYRLAADGVDRLYASDLGRARATADQIAQATGLSLVLDHRLRERHFGLFHGLTPQTIQERHPAEYAGFNAADPDFRIPGGESLRELHQRAVSCLEELTERHRGERLILVTHGGALAALVKHVLDLPLAAPRPFRVLNAAYNLIRRVQDRWLLEVLGDVSHLQSPAGPDDVV